MTHTVFHPARIALALSFCLIHGSFAASVSLSNVPLDVALNSANSVMVIDNSGSMDWEILISRYESGIPSWTGSAFSSASTRNSTYYPYLFPMNIESNFTGDRHLWSIDSVPPFSGYAYLRSPNFNSLYYNPRTTYKPWPAAVIGGTAITFPDSPSTAARTHPYFTAGVGDNSGTATTFNLEGSYFGNTTTPITDCTTMGSTGPTANNGMWLFTVKSGMSVDSTVQPSGTGTSYPVCFSRATTTGPRGNRTTTYSWVSVANADATEISGGFAQQDLLVMAPYNPATFWWKDANCTAGWPTCSDDPSGNHYRRYDINSFTGSSYTLAGGITINRTKAEELQNFANWFTYYRKRKLLTAGGVGKALDTVQDGYRQFSATLMPFNTRPAISASSPTIYDFTSATDTINGRSLSGLFYSLHTEGGTPTIGSLDAGAQVYGYNGPFNNYLKNQSSTDSITDDSTAQEALRCSANTAFVITDGYANDYSGSNTIYSTAKTYYDNLRWWTTTGGKTMNTYGITLGALGTVYSGDTNAAEPSTWPTPSNDNSTAIDDLWHAAKYSKGSLLSASNADSLDAAISSIINQMFSSGTGTGLSYSNAKIDTGNNVVIQAGYDSGNWTGDLAAFSVYTSGTNAGYINYTDQKWSARTQLDSQSTRYVATSSGSGGIPFTYSALTTASLASVFNTQSQSDAENVIAWLRGDRSLEGTDYRKRDHLLGDIANSTPIFVSGAFANYSYAGYSTFAATANSRKKVVYVGANDGMLHAFDASNGQELWAYVPKTIHATLNALSVPAYQHKFYVDGETTAWDVEFTGTDAITGESTTTWNTVLIGGLRKGGRGYYALNVTSPELVGTTTAEKETDLAGKVLWDISSATTGFSNLGYSYGKPVIAKTADYGWVALLTSGYNTPDKKGHLYVVKVQDGTLVKDLEIAAPANGAAYDEVGLGQVQGVINYREAVSSQNTANLLYAYGGDLNGNLYRFDLSSSSSTNWSVSTIAVNLNAGNATGQAPITAAPDIALISTPNPYLAAETDTRDARDKGTKRLMVFVGNGKLIDATDLNSTNRSNGFFGIWDAWADTQDAEDAALVLGRTPCTPLSNCLMQVGHGQGASSLGLNNWNTALDADLNAWWKTGGSKSEGPFTYAGDSRSKRGWYIQFSTTATENVVHAPVVYKGKVIFTASTKASNEHLNGTCEKAFSSLYNMYADKGGSEANVPARINLGFGIASGVSIIQLPNGTSYATGGTKEEATAGFSPEALTGAGTQCVTNKGCGFRQDTGGGSIAPNAVMRRYGWREIYR